MRKVSWLAAVCVALFASQAVAAPPTAKLERLGSSPQLLQPPEGVSGDFSVAKEAPEIDFAVYPGQWEGARLWSCWGDSLFASNGSFYGSIGDHAAPHGTAYVYRIDPEKRVVEQVVDYNAHVKAADDKYTPGKIHGALVEAGDGWIYFFGYRGSVRRTGEESGYRGDWLLRHNPETGETENLGIGVPYCSVPVLLYHEPSHSLYGLAVPGKTAPEQTDRFFRYDLEKGKLVFVGGPTPNISRALILSDDGRAYYTVKENDKAFFARYDPKKNRATKTGTPVPGDGRLRAASRPDDSGVVYAISNDGLIFSFDTGSEKTKPHKPTFVTQPLYTATCRLDPSGRYLYYVPGAHGRTSKAGTPVLQFDVKTGRRKVIAFLNEFVLQKKKYNLGGTYGIALNEDGSQLYINFNGAPPGNKQPDFGLCSAVIVHIPASERAASAE